MKTSLIYMFLIQALLIVACNKQLDQLPTTSKNLETFLSNEKEAEEYIHAAYGKLQAKGLYGLYLPAIGEIPSDNTYDEVPANDAGMYGELDFFTTVPYNDILDSFWKSSYSAIQNANVVLNRIDKIKYAKESVKNNRTGEMKFIRALLYFNLVRTFGDVPLNTEETTDPNKYFGQGRTAADTVYAQIVKDLNEAIAVLPAKTEQSGRVIKTAAQALLGKVYLTLKDYPNAKTQLDAVRTAREHSLQSNITTLFDINNKSDKSNNEIIFAVQFASGINSNSEGSILFQQFSPSASQSGAKGHNLPTKELYRKYTAADLRKGAYVNLAASGSPYCNKYKEPPSTAPIADGGSNVVVLRYADVLLMLAEAENELSPAGFTAAADYLNEVRKRAIPSSRSNALTQADMRAAIDLERRLELVGEGHRWFDLVRTGAAVSVMNEWFAANGIRVTIDNHNLLMRIPQSQIDTDPAIKQNTGY